VHSVVAAVLVPKEQPEFC